MLLLHTSDWHLGRSLHRVDLRDAQAAFLDSLVEVVRREKVDAVLVAGDVYDRAIPPVEAVAVCEDALFRLREAGARVIVTSGNHDSARRLGFGSRLVDASGVHLRTSAADVAAPVLLEDAAGAVGIYALPYLEPEAARYDLPAAPDGSPGQPGRDHTSVLQRAMDCVHADRRARRLGRAVVLAHAWVTGGHVSESERDIAVGGVGSVPAHLFGGVDYAALGHLHGPQVLEDGLRYSGSPLAYSFSEAAHHKGSWLVELDGSGLHRVEKVEAPRGRRLSSARGTVDDLLTSPRYRDQEDHFLSVVLTDAARPEDAMRRLRRRFPHVLVLDWQPEGGLEDDRTYRARVRGRSDAEVTEGFVTHVRRTAANEIERGLLAEALADGARAEATA
ncbi:MAG TPA: exonuclease SbcCD subunit D [Frankiaceae bacterium]|nr:exonuclease SbcCD subunit D [Frankiaceae bacterium]